MKGILTAEEKQYLRRVSNYLNSMGMSDGNIEVDMDSSDTFDFDNDIDWEYITHFSNNYRAEIPEGLIPILKKIASALNENGINNSVEDINWERLEFDIDTEKKEISANHLFSYYGRGDSNSIDYDSEGDIERFDRWMDEELAEVSVPNNGILTLRYNGSGDSGYIESSFEENNDSVPAAIEDWCYTELEGNFGGWEINEGSDGEFIFNFNDSTVTLSHTYNTEENSSDTLYEESFEF